jgi:hypothetical protein
MISEAATNTVRDNSLATDTPQTTAPVNVPATAPAAATTTADKKAPAPTGTQTEGCQYRWRTGDCLANYGNSAKIWADFSSTDEFATGFMAIIVDETMTNDTRAARVEEFLLEQATKAGVLDVSSSRRTFTNPNQWDKHLAPWFNPKCAETRRMFKSARRRYGKCHARTLQALQEFIQSCKNSRAQMQF